MASLGPTLVGTVETVPGPFMGPSLVGTVEVKVAVKIKGKQIAEGSDGIATANIVDGAIAASVAGRAKIATGFFDAATVNDKFGSGAIALDRLAEAVLQADGGQALTGDLPAGGFKITGLGAPTADGDSATKSYVDSVAAGLDPKESVRAATTANIANLATGAPNTVDGVTLQAGDRILVKSQTDQTENGIYVVDTVGTGADGAWSRASDFDGSPSNEVSGGNFTFVEEGTANADSGWVVTADGTLTVGTDNITWVQFSGAGQITAGAGLTKTGSTLDVGDANKGVQVNADDIQIDASEMSGDGLEQTAGGGNEHLLKVKPDVTTGGDVAAVSVGVNGVGLDVTALDGDHLDVTFTPANYTPDATPAEAADVDDLAAHLQGIDTALANVAVPTTSDKAQSPTATAGDGSSTGLTISATPGLDSYVQCFINGIKYELGDGVKTKDCYFSADGGTTAKSIANITSGDVFYWNGTTAGFELATTDEVDFDYVT